MDICGRVEHELELRQDALSHRHRQRPEVVEHARGRDLVFRQLPGRDLLLDAAPEEFGLADAVDVQQLTQLLELQRPDALSRLEGADALFTHAREPSDILLTQPPKTTNLP